MNPPQVYMCSPSWTLLPPPSPYPPSGSSPCTRPQHPVSCIEPELATRFIHDILHVSMPFSQIVPLSPSPTESIRLFYTSVSLLLSCTQGYCYHLSKFHIYALVYCINLTLEQGKKETIVFYSPCRVTPACTGVSQEAEGEREHEQEPLLWSLQEHRWDQKAGIRLTSLKNFSGLWGMGPSTCLILGPGLIRAGK